MDDASQEITTLVGREVYSNNGIFVGEVEDIRLDIDGCAITGLALTSLNDELLGDQAAGSRGVIIPYRWVRSVGDVILVTEVVERFQNPEADDEIAA